MKTKTVYRSLRTSVRHTSRPQRGNITQREVFEPVPNNVLPTVIRDGVFAERLLFAHVAIERAYLCPGYEPSPPIRHGAADDEAIRIDGVEQTLRLKVLIALLAAEGPGDPAPHRAGSEFLAGDGFAVRRVEELTIKDGSSNIPRFRQSFRPRSFSQFVLLWTRR